MEEAAADALARDRAGRVTTRAAEVPAWRGFVGGAWQRTIDVRDFIQKNLTPYAGDERFLAEATPRTRRLWACLQPLLEHERARGVLDVSQVPSSITAHAPGHIDGELIVGLQTDAPLKRAVFPNTGLATVEAALEAHGFCVDAQLRTIFTRFRKTHRDGVLDAYPADVRKALESHVITGLPDGYGRGRIIGDYRRVPLYGVARLIEQKQAELASLDSEPSSEQVIRDREELSEQVRALRALIAMADSYGHDVRAPAQNARQAVQWLYFAYLAAIKDQNGAAMSLGRVSTFLDAYIQRDLTLGRLVEAQAQELIDDLAIKLRLVRFLRTPDYERLFSVERTWITEAIGGVSEDGRSLVTKSSYRFLHTLSNLGPSLEPNLTVLWSASLPEAFKRYCARLSMEVCSIQYESDELLRDCFGDDTAISCRASAIRLGKQAQFFGARVNLAKCLLYALNGGRDELTGEQVMPAFPPLAAEVLQIDEVEARFQHAMDWLARTYVSAMNCIHYMHDKYAYERLQMALLDHPVERTMAFGVAGLSVVADSLSAIEHAKVRPLRDASGLIVDYLVSGDFPKFGNDDDRVDQFATSVVADFMDKLRRHATYRDAVHTQSVLTGTSNVVYGLRTGSTPDGRRSGQPFAPGANPVLGRDRRGLVAAAMSVAKLPYEDCQDGISLTASLAPAALGSEGSERVGELSATLDRLFEGGLFHVAVELRS